MNKNDADANHEEVEAAAAAAAAVEHEEEGFESLMEHQGPTAAAKEEDMSNKNTTKGITGTTGRDEASSSSPRFELVPGTLRGPAASRCGHHKWHPTHALLARKDHAGVMHTFYWDARTHRKLRYLKAATTTSTSSSTQYHPASIGHRLSFWSWEPRIVTWYNLLIGIVANTLWVVNGLYAVWPNQAKNASSARAEMISYVTGVVGAFLFIVTGYLGYIEAINQTYAQVRVPTPTTSTSSTSTSTSSSQRFRRSSSSSSFNEGWNHPLRHILRDERLLVERLLVAAAPGLAWVKDTESGHIVTNHWLSEQEEEEGGGEGQSLVGRPLEIIFGGFTLKVAVQEVNKHSHQQQGQGQDHQQRMYRWWTWTPDFHELAVVNALVFFIATIIFFIPATVWWPMAKQGTASLASTIFWNYVLQIIPSIAFVYVGYAAMAEASGSWTVVVDWTHLRSGDYSIGWWASLCNTVGGVGFLLYPILYLPAVVGDPGCCDTLVKWGASFATFWGSCSFWIAGILQWMEFCSHHPVGLPRPVQ